MLSVYVDPTESLRPRKIETGPYKAGFCSTRLHVVGCEDGTAAILGGSLGDWALTIYRVP